MKGTHGSCYFKHSSKKLFYKPKKLLFTGHAKKENQTASVGSFHLIDCQYRLYVPPLPNLEIEDLICCNNPRGVCLRQFVKPQHLLQHFRNTETKRVHSIISPRVVDFLISLLWYLQREMCCFLPLSFPLLERLPDSKSEQL